MARIFSHFSFDTRDINFNQIAANAINSHYYDDIDFSFNDHVYNDFYEVVWNGSYATLSSVFGGDSIESESLVITGGTVTGYLEFYWNDEGYHIAWGAENISISAVELYQAVLSETAEDDFAIFNEALSGDDQFLLSDDDDYASGLSGNDTFEGGSGKDTLIGGAGKDELIGSSGKDLLKGGRGKDILQGGAGKDKLVGGSGADKFVFSDPSDSKTTAKKADLIKDFEQGKDAIDLTYLNVEMSDLAFMHNPIKDYTMVLVDIDNDGAYELGIKLKGPYDLTADDFML